VKEQSLKLYAAAYAAGLNIAAWTSETWPKVLATVCLYPRPIEKSLIIYLCMQIDEYAPGFTDKAAELGKLGWQYTKDVGAIGYGYAITGVSWINKNAFE
jgi:hypothetical protein